MNERGELQKHTSETAKNAWLIYATYWIFPEVSFQSV